MFRELKVCVLGAALILLAMRGECPAASFQWLGIPAGKDASIGHEISGDGSTVVGQAINSAAATNDGAIRWSAAGGMQYISRSSPGPGAFVAAGVNGDGSVIVGQAGSQAFRWTPTGGLVQLGLLYFWDVDSLARAVSTDGTTIVGASGVNTQSSGGLFKEAFRWTAATGMEPLPSLTGGAGSTVAYDVDADGSVVVGRDETFGGQAFRWTQASGTVSLGDLDAAIYGPNDLDSQANATSADGSVIVGHGTPTFNQRRAMRWTQATGMVALQAGLGFTPSRSQAWDVSADGSIIVGDGVSSGPNTAFVWRADTGMVLLSTILTNAGINLTGWSLDSARSISADGTTITGVGTHNGNQEAFVAVIPEPHGAAMILVIGVTLTAFCSLRRVRRAPQLV